MKLSTRLLPFIAIALPSGASGSIDLAKYLPPIKESGATVD